MGDVIDAEDAQDKRQRLHHALLVE